MRRGGKPGDIVAYVPCTPEYEQWRGELGILVSEVVEAPSYNSPKCGYFVNWLFPRGPNYPLKSGWDDGRPYRAELLRKVGHTEIDKESIVIVKGR